MVGHEAGFPVNSAAFSPDGTNIITASWDGTVRIWDALTARQITILSRLRFYLNSAVYSPDGTRVVIRGFSNDIRLLDATTGGAIAISSGYITLGNSRATFSSDGNQIVTNSGNNAILWNIATIPKGNIFEVACTYLPDHEIIDLAQDYGLVNLEPFCKSGFSQA
jgi:WD40 repeat protein